MKRKRSKKDVAQAAPALASTDDSKRWQAEDDLRTIDRAHEIIGDRGRLGAVRAHAKRQSVRLDRIARLKDQKL